MFRVPEFFIIPVGYPSHTIVGTDSYVLFTNGQVRRAFDGLGKPVIARSSSPVEDGLSASFAGLFKSVSNLDTFGKLRRALAQIDMSAHNNNVKKYAEKMAVDYDACMAFIVQQQVTDFAEKGVIQLDGGHSTIEVTSKTGNTSSHEIEDRVLNEICPSGKIYSPDETRRTRDWVGEGEFWYAVRCAKESARHLGLDGVVQVEFLLAPERQPRLVQIRQLPKINSHACNLDLDVPNGVPYIESEVCNGVAGEVILPAYVTFSQSGLSKILIESGQKKGDERSERWRDKSRLYLNEDWMAMQNLRDDMGFMGIVSEVGMDLLDKHDEVWGRGNDLFPEYVLVCDKLDETITGMARVTTGKKAIITCLEASKTSHAMTVARDLGIPAMGVNGRIMELDSFYNQVETGDIVHMKSDGRRAVAYVQKRRGGDPYIV